MVLLGSVTGKRFLQRLKRVFQTLWSYYSTVMPMAMETTAHVNSFGLLWCKEVLSFLKNCMAKTDLKKEIVNSLLIRVNISSSV